MNAVQYGTSNPLPPAPIQGADVIAHLPADKTPPSPSELQIVNTLFKEHGQAVNSIVSEAKDAVLVALLFIIFSLPQLDDIIKKFVAVADKSPYILLIIKALLVASLYWIIKHFYLSRK